MFSIFFVKQPVKKITLNEEYRLGGNVLIDNAKGSIRLAGFGIAKDLQVRYMNAHLILSPFLSLLFPFLLFNYLNLQLPFCQQVLEL